MYVVLLGNVKSGFMAFGPFASEGEARDFVLKDDGRAFNNGDQFEVLSMAKPW